MSVTVIMASIPKRTDLRQRAMKSVVSQTMKADVFMVEIDYNRVGAAAMRDAMLKRCDTKYVCILDDDDYLLPNHIETLYNVSEEQDADLVYPWHRLSIEGYGSHLEKWRGVAWNDDYIHQVPITWMAKTESLKAVGGFSLGFDPLSNKTDESGNRIGEDYLMIHKLVAAGMKIVHVNEETWIWNWHDESTHGRPDRW